MDGKDIDFTEFYKMVTEAVPNIIWAAEPDGNLDYYNQRLYDYAGVDYSDIKGDKWINLLHPDDIKHVNDIWRKSLISGEGYDVEFRMKRRDGVYRWFISRAIPIKDRNEKIVKWIGFSTDIENRKHVEDELREKNSDLDNFVYMASHDLKAPVANIEGLVKYLPDTINEKCKNEEDVNSVLGMINDSIKKFKNILLDMIEITKSQQNIDYVVNNDFSDIVDSVKTILKEPIQNSKAEINTNFKDASKIKYSRKNLQSILYNLISNSIKYRSAKRTLVIDIETKYVNDYLILSVKDNGMGFKKHHISKVFKEFKRFHKKIEGSGVGLYLVKRIINSTGGKIELDSKEEKYSIFKVYFKI